MVFYADAVESVCFLLSGPFDDRMFPAERRQSEWSRSVSSVSCHSQKTDGTDATMLDPASRSGSSVSCHSKSTDGTDATMSDLEEDVLMGGQVVMGKESTGGGVK